MTVRNSDGNRNGQDRRRAQATGYEGRDGIEKVVLRKKKKTIFIEL
jgi:hypothetical protein